MSDTVALPIATRYVAPRWVQMAAATVGNALETFDILVYGYLAVTLSSFFSPLAIPRFSPSGFWHLCSVIRDATSGSGFFGRLCRSPGPKKALTLSIQLMMAGTAMMALMPPFASIGMVAPIGILAARLLQAFSYSGEICTSTAFMTEQTKTRKGFYASWQGVSNNVGKMLSALFGVFLATELSPAQLRAWGCGFHSCLPY